MILIWIVFLVLDAFSRSNCLLAINLILPNKSRRWWWCVILHSKRKVTRLLHNSCVTGTFFFSGGIIVALKPYVTVAKPPLPPISVHVQPAPDSLRFQLNRFCHPWQLGWIVSDGEYRGEGCFDKVCLTSGGDHEADGWPRFMQRWCSSISDFLNFRPINVHSDLLLGFDTPLTISGLT